MQRTGDSCTRVAADSTPAGVAMPLADVLSRRAGQAMQPAGIDGMYASARNMLASHTIA